MKHGLEAHATLQGVKHKLAGSDLSAVDQRLHAKLQEIVHLCQRFGSQNDALARSHRVEKFHLANARKEKSRRRLLGVRAGRGNASGLCQRFGKNHTWHERVVRKMAGEHGIVALESCLAFSRYSRIAGNNRLHEKKRRLVRKIKHSWIA